MRASRLLGALAVLLAASAVCAERVTIVRDTWGVPHIYADTIPGFAYGLGWAQAEDRLEQLLRNYRLATGTMAEAFGPNFVQQDWQQRLVGQIEVCRRRYPELPAEVRAAIEAFQAGVKAYMARHPDEVPEWAPQLRPYQAVALGRMIILNWPLGRARSELQRRAEVDVGFGSNQWAVRPERTEMGCAVLCIDPHIPWDGPFRFYEFRAHARDFHVSGFGPLGAPVVGLGHNDRLGWACTTGGPDTTDVYVEQINPDNPLQYKYDGEWRDMTVRKVVIAVKGAEPVERLVESTHHGPIMLREGNRAYALACPYIGEVDLVTQLYRMNTANNLAEFKAAVGMNQLMEQNVMYADVEGNIFYVRTGRVPIRPTGYDFGVPVPGNTSATEWKGLHPMSDLVQMLNPPSGWMQNCNIGPDTMTEDCPISADDYPDYIYGARPGASNSRGRRASELLAKGRRLTLKGLMAIVLDTHAQHAEQWQAAVAAAVEALSDDPRVRELKPALDILAAWNGRMDSKQPGATLYRVLRETAKEHDPPIDAGAIAEGKRLSRRQRDALLDALSQAAATLIERYGRLKVRWGDVHRIRRGDTSYPVSGGDTGGGSTLRAVGTDREDGIYYGRSGQSWTQLVILKKGDVRSYSATPWGQSDDPDSPHYFDQGEQLFSKSRLKDTWFQPHSEAGHVETTTTLYWEGA